MKSIVASILASALTASAATPAPEAYEGVDFFLCQDVSYSYENDLPYLHDQIPKIIAYLATEYDDSAFGMATFVDKPMGSFGYEISGDYCYDLTFPLVPVTLKEKNIDGEIVYEGVLDDGMDTEIDSILDNLDTYSGRDWPENQLGAVLHTLLSDSTKWRSETNRAPIIALATDSGFHRRGDAPHLLKTKDIYAKAPENWCLTEDYPSVEDLRGALEKTGARLLLLVTPDLVGYYEDFLKELGPEFGIVVGLRQRSAYIAEAVQTGLEFLRLQGHGFGVAATLRFKELLAAEADAISVESKLNMEQPEAPSAIEDLQIDDQAVQSFGTRKKLFQTNVRSDNDNTDINSFRNIRLNSPWLAEAGHGPQGVDELSPESILYCGEEPVVFQVVLVQDASESFENDKMNIAREVPNAFRNLQTQFPGSKFGLTAFVDKPIEPFGYESANDYCASMRVGLTEDVDDIESSIDTLIIRSGNDPKESQLHGLMHTAYTHMAGWSDTLIDEYGRRVIRVAALTTDAGYHEAGDSELPSNNGDRYQDCEGEDYPSVEQVGDALRGQMIYPLFLVTDNVKLDYEMLLTRMDTNGAVRVMGNEENLTQTLQDSLIGGLQSICNFKSVTPENSRGDLPPDLELSGDEVIELEIQQRPKFLSIVTKK